MSLLTAVLPWLLPPVCGGLAGYGIGRLASHALARSLIAKHRFPFDIARGFHIDALSARVLAIPVAAIVPGDGSPAALSLERTLAGLLGSFLGSRGTIYAVREAVSNLVAGAGARKVGEVSRQIGLPSLIAGKLLPTVLDAGNRAALSRAAGELLAAQAGTALDDEVLGEVSVVVESHLPDAADALVRWLRSPETREVLSERGRELLPRILLTLSEMQRLFISAGQFDRRLNEKMPEIIDETIAAVEKLVRDPLQQKRIAALLLDAARDWRDSLRESAPDPARPMNNAQQKLSESASGLFRRILEGLDNGPTRQAIAERAAARLEKDHRTVAAFFRDVFGVADAQVVEVVSSRVLSFLTGPESAQLIARRLCSLLLSSARENADGTLAAVLGMDTEKKARLDAFLGAAVPRVVSRHFLPVLGEAVAASPGFGNAFGLFGGVIGFVAGLVAVVLRLID